MLIGLLLIFASVSYGQTTIYGGRGMLRVFSAKTVQPGSFYLNSFFMTFLNNTATAGLEKDYTLNFGLTYGLSSRLELTAQIIAYQDDQRHVFGPPGNTQLGLKWQSPLSSSAFSTGLRGFIIIPTAQNQNVPFEPFSSDKLAWGITGLITLDMTHTFPLFPLKLYTNIGYLDHDISTFFSNEVTDQLQLGFGFKMPVRSVILYSEYTGEIFLNASNVDFSNNSMRVTQGLKFVGPLNVIVDLAVDVGLSKDLNSFPVHDYADWKFIAGLSYQFFSSKSRHRSNRISRKRQMQDAGKTNAVKSKRDKVEEDLDKLRKKLEDDSDEKP